MKMNEARAELEELKKELSALEEIAIDDAEEEEEDLSEYIDEDTDNARYMAMALNLLDFLQTWMTCNLKKNSIRLALGESSYAELVALIQRTDKFISDYDLQQLDGGEE